ncbi:serine/threonine-protein phosphatase, partial [Streptomyces sp. NPDC056121]
MPHVGGGREYGNSEEYDVELRQVATLNRLAGPTIGGSDTVSGPVRHRGADLLVTGHALARATSLGEALALISQLADPGLPLCGQAVFRSDRDVMKCVGQVGFRDGEVDALRLPIGMIHPVAQVARTGRPVFLASPQEYRDRFPTAWQLGGPKRYEAWAFLPLTTYNQLTGVWMAAFDAPVQMTDGLGPLLVTMARLLSQSIEQSYDG